jgi:hypothetical protein
LIGVCPIRPPSKAPLQNARRLSNTFAGIAPSSVPLFIAAQLGGAIEAVIVVGWLFKAEPAA